MSQAHSTFSMLDQLSRAQAERRSYVDILFSGFESSTSDGLLSLLRSAGLSPRGRVIKNKLGLTEALAERSWDMVFAHQSDRSDLSPAQICALLQADARDIPIIQLAVDPNYEDQHRAIQQGISFLLPQQANGLIIARASELFERQRLKRRLHGLELGIQQIARVNKRLSEESTLAVAAIFEHQLIEPNSSFRALFQLPETSDTPEPLKRIFTEESLKQVETTLKSPAAYLHEVLTLIDDQGGEFTAQVDIYPATPDQPRQRTLFIDPMALTTGPTPAELEEYQLLNQGELEQCLETQLQRAAAGGQDAFLLYFDIQSVPTTIDQQQLGRLKHALAKQLAALRQKHAIALLDPCNIAILIDTPDRSVAKSIAQLVRDRLTSSELQLPKGINSLALGVGISSINDNSPTATELLKGAERSVKALGNFERSSPVFANPVQHQMQIESATKELEEAIVNHQLKLLFQPLVSLNEQSVERSYEILVRMSDGQNRYRLPAQFLASLEHARVMVKLDRWVVENSLLELKRQIRPDRELRIYINLARRTLKSESFARWFCELLEELNLSGNFIVIELSESDVAADMDNAVELCQQLRTRGVGVCIKHFGSSTSSTTVYTRIRPEFVKLDGGYIEELELPERGQRAIRRLLEPLDREATKVIAPLIEDPRLLPDLYRLGFDLVQGYYLQPPQEEMGYEYFD